MGMYSDISTGVSEAMADTDGLYDAVRTFTFTKFSNKTYNTTTGEYSSRESRYQMKGFVLKDNTGKSFQDPLRSDTVELLIMNGNKTTDFEMGMKIAVPLRGKTEYFELKGIDTDPIGVAYTLTGEKWS